MTLFSVPAPRVIRSPHVADHHDTQGFCRCGCSYCVGNDGKCTCRDCLCRRVGTCEADEGPCYLCFRRPA